MSIAFDHSKTWSAVKFLACRLRRDMQFSGIFLCDFFAAVAFALASVYLLNEVKFTLCGAIAAAIFFALVVIAQGAKIFGVILLEKRGGDAREFIGSDTLVTDGAYRYSRNPVYLVSILQSVAWSLLLLVGALTQPLHLALAAAALVIPVAHFVSIDRLIIPNEEEALRRVHPQSFADYAARVNRWFGRRAA